MTRWRVVGVGLALGAFVALGWWIARGRPPRPVALPPPTVPHGYRVPVQADAPWPTFRRDHRNTGRSLLPARYAGDRPWSFATGKGIFSTPVIDRDGVAYVGSADRVFYAIGADGRERWRFETGGIIDSAAALGPVESPDAPASVTMIAGDGAMRRLRTDARAAERLLWRFDASSAPGAGFNDWFEGNVAVGFDGTLYAGNTNFNYYAIAPDGRLRWAYRTGSNNWSIAAFADDGAIYWGSNDGRVHAVGPDGRRLWTKRTLGFIAASAALGSDGTVYVGSFDGHFYALDPRTGRARWRFRTGDHVYASAALGADAQGRTDAVYFGSTDGWLYALAPDGRLLWRSDVGDPIRSSPALGAGPDGEADAILYFGSGDGRLHALDTERGQRRWSFDTTPEDPALRDRNDLNGSPALGATGIWIGGEHGRLWYVPYDWCLERGRADPRCRGSRPAPAPADGVALRFVTPGGTTLERPPGEIPAAPILTLRLLAWRGGERIDAHVCNLPFLCDEDELRVRLQPPMPFRVEPSADGRHLHVLPDRVLEPGEQVELEVDGTWYTGGWRIGNWTLGGDAVGRFRERFAWRVAAGPAPPPLRVGPDETSALEWTRLAAPLPTMLASLNQIGFDDMHWILGAIEAGRVDARGEERLVLWAVGARRDARGLVAVDPATEFLLPLAGVERGGAFALESQGFVLPITGIPIPFDRFELRGRRGADGVVQPGAAAWAETGVLSIPNFGPYLVLAGLASYGVEKLLALGTYEARPYDPRGGASRRPPQVSVASVTAQPSHRFSDGAVEASFRIEPGANYPRSEHVPAILVLDSERRPLAIDYGATLESEATVGGDLASVRLRIPAGVEVPAGSEIVVILDVFPMARVPWEAAARAGP